MQRCSSASKRPFTRRLRNGSAFEADIVSDSPGIMVLSIKGNGAKILFANEPGGHRWQRVPPNERHGRRQSSTVTVAVMESGARDVHFDERRIAFKTSRCGGPGGQNVNKLETKVTATYIPTGDVVSVTTERSQLQNKQQAVRMLRDTVVNRARRIQQQASDASRKQQVGKGERSDKVRTVQVHNGQVTDHRTGRRITLESYLKGNLP